MFRDDTSRLRAKQFQGLVAFERLISDLSSRFIDLPPGGVDAEIERAQRLVCEFLEVDRSVLWQRSGAVPAVLAPTHVYMSSEFPRSIEPLRQDQFPWMTLEMLAGRTVAVSSLDALPEAAAVDRETGRGLGIQSHLAVPLSVGGEPPIGVLTFNTLRRECDWPETLVKRLQLVSQIIAHALARRRQDEALRASEERLSLAADSASAGLWTFDLKEREFWVTERTRALFGYSEHEVISLDRLQSSVLPEDRDLVLGAIDKAVRTSELGKVDYRIRLPDGRIRWIVSRGRPHVGPAGEVERLMGVSIDITDRKTDEEAYRASEARLVEAAELASLGLYEVEDGYRVTFVDERARDILGMPQDGRHGTQLFEFWREHLHPEDRERVLDMHERLNDGRVDRASAEYRYLHPVRLETWHHHVARVTRRDAAGRAVRTFGVLRDITQSRQREEALRQSYAEIERLRERLQAESDYLKAEIRVAHPQDEVTGESPAVQKVLRLVEQVAPTDSSVLVRGETGSGKELIAQAIHRLSARRGHLMVKVNCAALPSGLVESELFGREKGAYTGAMTRQIGRFEVADGSTIFLDEIGELSLEVQAKLLRVLELGEFERLGSPRTVKVNVRLIAATNRDLPEEIRKGRFREDLYYRLNVFPIHVPPLRERVEDIPLLVWTFLGEFSTRMGKKITQVPRKTMEALQRQPWPGNVRELRNVIEHAAIITTGETLQVPLLDDIRQVAQPPQTLADSERAHILRALEGTGWRVKGPKGAAAAVGLNPSTLYSRMKKLGIRPPTKSRDN